MFLLYILVFLSQGMWDLNSPNGDWTCIESQSPNQWAVREVLLLCFLIRTSKSVNPVFASPLYDTTEELYKKDLHDPDNHDGVITHLEPDILECEVKWALESIPMNKASGDDGIPVELFQILEDDAVKVLPSICQQIWEAQQWPQDWKQSVFIPIPKNGQTTA